MQNINWFRFIAGRGMITRQYALAGTLGIPYTVTIDRETLEDSTLTIRERNTKGQERVPLQRLADRLHRNLYKNP